MEPRYRHTQVGWVIILSTLAPALVIIPVIALAAHATIVVFAGALFALIVPLFGWMTVTLDAAALRIRLGLGAITKTVPLQRVRAWHPVRNSVWMGWGIRIIPGGTLWNVSGLDAVELVLDNGRRLRVGTDEPDALARALTSVLGPPRDLTADEQRIVPIARGRIALLVAAFVLGLVAVIGGLMAAQMRPPRVRVTTDGVYIESLFYGQTYVLSSIEEVELIDRLPRIRIRTNGFAAAGVLRGHFRLEALGDGKLFVNLGAPPYVLLRLRDGYVIVNFPDAAQTRALHREIEAAGRARS